MTMTRRRHRYSCSSISCPNGSRSSQSVSVTAATPWPVLSCYSWPNSSWPVPWPFTLPSVYGRRPRRSSSPTTTAPRMTATTTTRWFEQTKSEQIGQCLGHHPSPAPLPSTMDFAVSAWYRLFCSVLLVTNGWTIDTIIARDKKPRLI
jgi:hypothetical protein